MIFSLLAFLDKNKKFDLLPRCVTDSADSVPSYEGGLSVLMRVVEKMEQEIKELNLALASFRREFVQLETHRDCAPVFTPWCKHWARRLSKGVSHSDRCPHYRRRRRYDVTGFSTAISWSSLAWSRTCRSWLGCRRRRLDSNSGYNWYSALASTDDEERDSELFVEWSSRRPAKRHQVQSQQESRQHPATQRRGRGRGQTVMTGKSNSAAHQFTAARKIVRKAVFYVDNVDLSLDVDDLRQFVTGQLKVQVFFPAFRFIQDAEEMTQRWSLIAKPFDCVSLKLIVADFWVN